MSFIQAIIQSLNKMTGLGNGEAIRSKPTDGALSGEGYVEISRGEWGLGDHREE